VTAVSATRLGNAVSRDQKTVVREEFGMRPKESPLQKLLCAMILTVTLALVVFVTCIAGRVEPPGATAAQAANTIVLQGAMTDTR
jgi:hypothetical protein